MTPIYILGGVLIATTIIVKSRIMPFDFVNDFGVLMIGYGIGLIRNYRSAPKW